MSALLFALLRDRIVILVDSQATGCASVAKLWPIIHVPAVICGRGPVGFLIDVAQRATAIAADFDRLIERMPTALDAALRANASNIAGLAERDRRLEVYAAGISPNTSRSTVCSYVFTDSGVSAARYERTSETGDYVVAAPWTETIGPMPDLAPEMDDTNMRALLRQTHNRQIQLMNEDWIEGSAGGKRIEVTITADSVTSVIDPAP